MHFRRLRMEPLEDRRLLATFTVTNLLDGVVTAAGQRPGTLRQAIFDANALAGPDQIVFTSAPGTINLSAGQLNITEGLTISGPGRDSLTINAQELSRVVNFSTATTHRNLTIEDLTIRDGKAATGLGGGINFNSTGTLSIVDANISENSTTATSANGGGIYSLGPLIVTNSLINENSTTGQNASGGGIYVEGAAQLNNSVVGENIARGSGGGIRATDTLTINNSAVVDNSTIGDSADGGGIYGFQDITIVNSTISGNSTVGPTADGAGIFTVRDLEISFSTLTDNITHGATAAGGGIAVVSNVGTRTVQFSHSIVAANNSTPAGDDFISFGAGTVTITSSYSLIGTTAGLTAAQLTALNSGTGNLLNVNPLLGPLQNNGGTTPTHALLPGSPALNAGNPSAVAGAGGIPVNDQRGTGFARVSGGRIDIGAFEVQTPTPSADFDGDGDVDGRDFLRWQRGFGAQYDNDDLVAWRNQYGTEPIIDLGTVVVDEAVDATFDDQIEGDEVALIDEPQLLALAVDKAFDNWPSHSRSSLRDFGDIAVHRRGDSRDAPLELVSDF